MGRHLTAAVCLNGHTATSSAESFPPGKFCETCGAALIMQCQKCRAAIRGYYHVDGVISLGDHYTPPAFCFNCGEAFPWTAARLAAAKDLTDQIDDLSDNDRSKIKEALEEISRDGPRTEVGATRLKKLLGKAKSAVGQAVWKASIEIATEAAKKLMLPP
jgi:hypothetical protein